MPSPAALSSHSQGPGRSTGLLFLRCLAVCRWGGTPDGGNVAGHALFCGSGIRGVPGHSLSCARRGVRRADCRFPDV